MQVDSELFAVATLGDADVQVHLVSWYVEPADEATEGSERYGIYIGTEKGGTLVATFEQDVPYDVVVSVFIAMQWAKIVDGSPRAGEAVKQFMPETETNLIIPDTTTVEKITK